MSTLNLVASYVADDVSLDRLHIGLREAERGEPGSDPLASRVLRLLGEATSAGWSEATLREELGRLYTDALLQQTFDFDTSADAGSGGDEFDPAVVSVTQDRTPQVA